ncbi:MAG: hypothetical protein ABI723_05210 [Bacteroidia bacterium]
MKKIIITAIALVFILSNFSFTADETEKKVIKSAQDNLQNSLLKIPAGHEKDFGFKNREEFALCTVGSPYRVITFTKDFYEGEMVANKKYIVLQNEWRIPVMVNGQNRILLTINANSDNYNVVDMGGAALAKELQQRNNAGNHCYILRVYPLACDFLVVAEAPAFTDVQCIPMTSAIKAIPSLTSNSKSFYSLSEAIQIIKNELKNQSKN